MSEQRTVFVIAEKLLTERWYLRFVRWWMFHKRRWVCRARLHHVWHTDTFEDKHGEGIEEERCVRCNRERGLVALFLLWGLPVVWRVSFRIKHGTWT